ncbi:SDR family oxidoreductase [Microtetraspora malaysiensis]|uniref:SDR family oxidoreductase n=1 Tax=Microtetraspora malaysiensis TaxID=161358 RepID=A0ABW6T7N3_9ACTN
MEPDLRASVDHHARIPGFVAEAVAAGVRRLVLLSAYGVGEADDSHPLKPAERAVRGSGVDWTILRPDRFAQNFSESFWLAGVLAGALTLPTGDGRTPFVDAEDIAEVAASALTEDATAARSTSSPARGRSASVRRPTSSARPPGARSVTSTSTPTPSSSVKWPTASRPTSPDGSPVSSWRSATAGVLGGRLSRGGVSQLCAVDRQYDLDVAAGGRPPLPQTLSVAPAHTVSGFAENETMITLPIWAVDSRHA